MANSNNTTEINIDSTTNSSASDSSFIEKEAITNRYSGEIYKNPAYMPHNPNHVFERGEFMSWFIKNNKKLVCPDCREIEKLDDLVMDVSRKKKIEIYLQMNPDERKNQYKEDQYALPFIIKYDEIDSFIQIFSEQKLTPNYCFLDTSLLTYAIDNDAQKIIKYLLKQPGLDINFQGKFKFSALHSAVFQNNIRVLTLLSNIPNIKVDQTDLSGKTPIEYTKTKEAFCLLVKKSKLKIKDKIDHLNKIIPKNDYEELYNFYRYILKNSFNDLAITFDRYFFMNYALNDKGKRVLVNPLFSKFERHIAQSIVALRIKNNESINNTDKSIINNPRLSFLFINTGSDTNTYKAAITAQQCKPIFRSV